MKSKHLSRIGFISYNALRQVLVSLFSMVIPFLVLHYSRKEIWGSFVPLLLFSLLAMQFISWGNKEYLLRRFSREPNKIHYNYSKNLATRLPLVFGFGLFGIFYFPAIPGAFMLLLIFGRFLSQSIEALIIYEKKFSASVWIEIAAFSIFCTAFGIFKSNLNTHLLLILYGSYQLLKGLAYFLLFRKFLSAKDFKMEIDYYETAFPFFLLSILGFLASKADVYLIAHLGNKIVTADYQVINSLLVFIMSLSAFIYAPFTKNIYRNNETVIAKTRTLLMISGFIIVPVSLLCVCFILKYYLHLQMPFVFYGVAFAYVYPSFLYGIEVVNLFRLHKERTVVWFLFVGAAANTALSAAFLYFGCGIIGALTGSAIAQLLALALFKFELYREK